MTRDIVAAMDRWERFHFARMLYVVDVAQSLHFQQLFTALGREAEAVIPLDLPKDVPRLAVKRARSVP